MAKKISKGFYHIWAWQPFWSMNHAHFSNLSFSCPRRLRMKFEQHWPGGFRGKAIWNYQHFFHTNVWDPYKCIQEQTWPRCKKVKCQCMTIILATLVDCPFPKDSATSWGFWGKAIWNYQHFFHTNVWDPYKCIQEQTWPRCKKVKCQCMTIILATLVDCPFPMIYAKIQPQAILGFRNKIFKCFFPIQMHREANDLAIKRSNVNVRPLF